MSVQDSEIPALIAQLEELHADMVRLDTTNVSGDLHEVHRNGASNLLHYVALRTRDIRDLQRKLSTLGLSSLGRTESHVLGAVEAVLDLLKRISPTVHLSRTEDSGRDEGRMILEENASALLGPAPGGRRVRIMVTMPSEAADDYQLVRDLIASGMNCMRINCAHDGPDAWTRMIANLRKAENELNLSCKVLMDVAGPKLRTGPIETGVAVRKVRPSRDRYGRVKSPARVWLTPVSQPEEAPSPADAYLPVSGAWLKRLKVGDRLSLVDTRDARRSLRIAEQFGRSWWAEATQTMYLVPGLILKLDSTKNTAARNRTRIGKFPAEAQTILLRPGDKLILTKSLAPGRVAVRNSEGDVVRAAQIGVTLAEFFDSVAADQPIWFDDGKIGGIVTSVQETQAVVNINDAKPEGSKLGAEKGINIPGADLRVPSLTGADLEALQFIAKNADIAGFSFVRTAEDVRQFREYVASLGRHDLGLLLKIETEQAFENLPQLLLEAMRSRAVGVMIARGDLAIECGWQRLAEIQEEILWISEAAHVPVVWATQVLESLAKSGVPSRSEITDAAMGERAECVMLNKGRYVTEAVQVLDDILRRMATHQEKKSSMLRKLNVAVSFDQSSRRGETVHANT